MAGRLRSVILVAAVVIGLLAAVPRLAVTSGSGTSVEHGAQMLPRHGLGACAPGAARCDVGWPTTVAGLAGVGATFVAAMVMLVEAVRRSRRRPTTPSLARGIPSRIDRPPQLLAAPY